MRPIDLARAVGVSTQTVRKYERWGFLPPAERSDSGYRRYGPIHLHAIRTARTMARGYGWMRALRIMQHVHRGGRDLAIAAVDTRHAEQHLERHRLTETLGALRTLTGAQTGLPPEKPLPIGQAAAVIGVEVSALRFWEAQGLVTPVRDRRNGYRRYDRSHMLHLQVIATLRGADYGMTAIREVLDELEAGDTTKALAAATQRLQDLTESSRRCAEATAAFFDYIASWWNG